MVGSVSSQSMVTANYSANSTSSGQNKLSSSQQETISSVLSQFDSSNLSQSDAKSIVESFKEVGIQPSKELASSMEVLGFDAQEVGKLAGVQGGPGGAGGMPPPPPPPPPNQEEEENSISALLDTLLDLSEDDEDEDSTTTSSVTSGTFDEVMEYTSRILNLNKTSKEEVMDLFERMSSDETKFTNEEKSTIVKNSLSQILGDSDNYNSFSFYA